MSAVTTESEPRLGTPGHLFDWLAEQEEKKDLHLPAPELQAMLIKQFELEKSEAVLVVRAYLDSYDQHGDLPPDRTGLPTTESFCDRCGTFLEATKRMTPRRYRCLGCGALLCEHQATVSTGGERWHKVYNKEQAVRKIRSGKKTKNRARKVIKTEYICGPCGEMKEES